MGRWVTLDDDQRVYINDKGQVLPRGPGTKPPSRGYGKARSEAERGKTAALVAKTRAKPSPKPMVSNHEDARFAANVRARDLVAKSSAGKPAVGSPEERIHAEIQKNPGLTGFKGLRRALPDIKPVEFDKHVMALANKGKIALHQSDIDTDREHAVKGEGRFFVGAAMREGNTAKSLHEHAQEAANAVPASKRFGDKAFLVDVHHEYQKTGGKLPIADFKQKLADSPEARVKLGMSRNDLNAREDHAKTQASEAQVKVGGRVLAEYHFVTTTGKAPAASAPSLREQAARNRNITGMGSQPEKRSALAAEIKQGRKQIDAVATKAKADPEFKARLVLKAREQSDQATRNSNLNDLERKGAKMRARILTRAVRRAR